MQFLQSKNTIFATLLLKTKGTGTGVQLMFQEKPAKGIVGKYLSSHI